MGWWRGERKFIGFFCLGGGERGEAGFRGFLYIKIRDITPVKNPVFEQ